MPDRDSDRSKIIDILTSGGVGILGTDTIYGLVGSALRPDAVERIYKLRYRDLRKPMIVLIGSLGDLNLFKIKLSRKEEDFLTKIWPGEVSVILSCSSNQFEYLHRGVKSLAFRLPKKKSLVQILRKTGPLTAPSANSEGHPPARTIKEAKKYFGDKVDFYLDEGRLDGHPSTLAALENGKLVIKRRGAVVLE
ncbi:MAG: L-threonylcarbamoyladenylate synthase [Candidatus Colwellbacteria bacterium]|nr:L-threonylcarbamoyladenylate synthase [Candidatus Colwellbacteria bacterium]